MSKPLFGRKPIEDERAKQLRKLKEALHNRDKKYNHDDEEPAPKPGADKSE